MSTSQGTGPQGSGWTPDPVPPGQGAGRAADPVPPWQDAGRAPEPRSPWQGPSAAPSAVTTTGATAAPPAADPYAAIDPFRTDGTSVLRTPPSATGGAYGSGARPGAWGPPPQWGPPPRTDGLAVTALVLGIAGVLLFPLVVSQVALALGIVGARRVRRTGDQGFGLAVAGIVLGALGTVGVLLLAGLFATFAWWGL